MALVRLLLEVGMSVAIDSEENTVFPLRDRYFR